MESPSGTCPRCLVALDPVVSPVGLRLRCLRCNGQAVAESVVARLTSPDEARELLVAAAQPSSGDGEILTCPWCRGPMRSVAAPTLQLGHGDLRIDVCGRCQVVWFDAGELEQIPRGTTVRTPAAPRPLACEQCGAPCRPDLDAVCGYCGHLLAPAQMPTAAAPERGGLAPGMATATDDAHELDGLTRSLRWLVKALRDGINAG